MKGIPVSFPPLDFPLTFADFVAVEGIPNDTSREYNGSNPASVNLNGFVGKANEMIYVDSVTISTNLPFVIQVKYNHVNLPMVNLDFDTVSFKLLISAGTHRLDIKRIIPNRHNFSVSVYSFDAAVINATTPVSCYCTVHKMRIPADLNLNAPRTALFVGDSITVGTLGDGITKDATYQTMVVNYFCNKGLNIRYSQRAQGGIDSKIVEAWRQQGMITAWKVKIGFYAIGTNDWNATTAAYMLNVTAFVNYWKGHFGCPLVLLGPPPRTDDAYELPLVPHRAALEAFVAADTSGMLFYCNIGTAFNRASNTLPGGFYVNPTDLSLNTGTGDGVHPNVAGHKAIFDNCLKPFLDANPNILV